MFDSLNDGVMKRVTPDDVMCHIVFMHECDND